MVDQAPVNGRSRDLATVGQVTTHASGLAHDLITLVELQSKLVYLDLRAAGSRSAAWVVSLAGMLALALSAVPVLLLGIAELLVQSGWRRSDAYLVVGGAAGVIAVVVGWISVQRLRRVARVFSRSSQELSENLEFIKSLVSRTDEPAGSPADSPRWSRD